MRDLRARLVRGALRVVVVATVLASTNSSSLGVHRTRTRSLADKLTDGPGVVNHPVGVRPSSAVRIPDGWPLDTDGTLACRTCHERLPSLQGGPAYLRGSGDRRAAPNSFCARCHEKGGHREGRTVHWMALGTAHIRGDSYQGNGSSPPLDGPSRQCLGCHDGVTASDARNPTGSGAAPRTSSGMRQNHPVGVRYPHGMSRKRGTMFRSVGTLPPEVRLPDDQVSCVSCHNLYSGRQSLLSIPIEQSKLCFTCHQV